MIAGKHSIIKQATSFLFSYHCCLETLDSTKLDRRINRISIKTAPKAPIKDAVTRLQNFWYC